MMKNYAAIILLTILNLTALAGFAAAQETRNGKLKSSSAKALTAPENDDFAQAQVVTLPVGGFALTLNANNISASKEANEPNHAENQGGSSVWFKFTPTATKAYEIRTTGNNTNFDTTLAVYTGNNLQFLTPVGYNDDCYESQCATRSRVRLQLAAGTTYYIAVDGFYNGAGTAAGSFDLVIASRTTAFDEDNIGSAYNLGSVTAASIAGTNYQATGQSSEPGHANGSENAGRSVWYRFQALSTRSMTVNMKDDFDNEIAVYESNVPNPTFAQLTKVAGVADHIGVDNTESAVTFLATISRHYFIAIDWNNDTEAGIQTGNFQLKLSQTKLRYSMRLDRYNAYTSLSIFRPSDAVWYSLEDGSPFNPQYQKFGFSTDVPVPADFDGDGRANYAVTRSQNGLKQWYFLHKEFNTTAYTSFQWGLASDKEIVGDFDRDGIADAAVIRKANGNLVWYVRRSSDLTMRAFVFGLTGDRPVLGDFDGDGATEVAVVREAANGLTWYILHSSGGNQGYTVSSVQQFGVSTDLPVAEDYDGDGKSDLAVFRPSEGTWYIQRSGNGEVQVTPFGTLGDKPQPGDYEGDGKSDLAVFRPATGDWYIWSSLTNTQEVIHWGKAADVPVSSMARFSLPEANK